MTKLVKKIISGAIALFFCAAMAAQQIPSAIQTAIGKNPEYSGGFYRNYPVPEDLGGTMEERPEGYVPFYISHYGRHGSRWISDRIIYDRASILMEEAEKAGVLTSSGRKVLEQTRILVKEAAGREGELSPQGVKEHRGIAERMFRRYPEVFLQANGTPVKIDSRATVYTRCIYSMISFDERLKELAPELVISKRASKKDLEYLADYSHTDESYRIALGVSDSLVRTWIRPERFLGALFSDQGFINKISSPHTAMYDFFHLASSLQATGHQDMDLYDCFTAEEIQQLWKVLNTQTYYEEGPSCRFGSGNTDNAKNLLKNIIATADQVIAGEKDEAATLRFGHESNIVPLLSLIGLPQTSFREDVLEARAQAEAEGTSPWCAELETASRKWNISEICPMATNLQFIFFRNADKQIKVRVLHNEKDAQLPVEGAPFYDWPVLRTYLAEKCK